MHPYISCQRQKQKLQFIIAIGRAGWTHTHAHTTHTHSL
jgi:hypothetical protein